ncbi:hypothetical protein ES707_11336 [subsurface metagenome]
MSLDASKVGGIALALAGLGGVAYLVTHPPDVPYGGGGGERAPASPPIVTPWKDLLDQALLDPGGVTFPTPEDAGGISMLYPMMQYAPGPVDYSGVAPGDKKGTILLADFLKDSAPPPAPELPGLPTLPGVFGLGNLLGIIAGFPGAPLFGAVLSLGQAAGQQIFGPQEPPGFGGAGFGGGGTGGRGVYIPDAMQAATGSFYTTMGSLDFTKKGTAAPQTVAPAAAVFAAAGAEPQEGVVVKKGQIVSAGSPGSSKPRGTYAPSGNVYRAPGTILGGAGGRVMSSKSAATLSGDSPSAVAWRAKYGGG